MKHVFVVNPVAGKGDSDTKLLPMLYEYVRNLGPDYEIHRTLNKAEVGSFVRKRAAEGEEVIFYACGGDGTVCDVLNGMFGFDNARLAVYPCGTGNDFVRNFTKREFFKDLDKLTNGVPTKIDVIKANDSYSANVINMGIDTDISDHAAHMKSSLVHGSMAYLLATLKILPQGRTYCMTCQLDDEEPFDTELMLATVANGQFYGGGFHSSPRASVVDGLMDICLVSPIKGKKLIKMLYCYHQGTHLDVKEKDEFIFFAKAKKFRITPKGKMRINIDGESEIMKETTFESIPKAITLMVPRGSCIINE